MAPKTSLYVIGLPRGAVDRGQVTGRSDKAVIKMPSEYQMTSTLTVLKKLIPVVVFGSIMNDNR